MEEGLLADVNGEFIPELIPENEDLVHVLDVLCTTGYGAWIVGGAVRDCILGKKPEEFDICTTATPEEVCEPAGVCLQAQVFSGESVCGL